MNEVIMKKCSGTCGEVKEVNKQNFFRDKKSKDKFAHQCKICYGKGVPLVEKSGILKKCSGICGLELDLNMSNFGRNKRSKNGFNKQCKKCEGKGKPEPEKIDISKKCKGICGEELDLSNFTKNKLNNDGYEIKCRKCFKFPIPDKIIEENGIKYQVCTGDCKNKKELNETNFGWRNKKNNKYYEKCKICMAEYKSKHYQENKEEILIQRKEYREENKDIIKIRKKEYREENKEEIAVKAKDYRKENKEEIKIQSKEYYEENKEELSIKHKKYRKENKKEIKIQSKEYNSQPENKQKKNERAKQRRLNDPKFKIRCNISSIIRGVFKRRNTKKTRSISKSLPYTIDEFITHLEIWFKKPGNEWMNLNNQGVYNPSTWDNNDTSTWVWHLDHIIPDIKFNYTSEDDQEFKDCWSLDNLRPLRADLNISEGARRTKY